MTPTFSRALCTAALLLLMSACGESTSRTVPSSATPSPSAASVFTSSDFKTAIPEGWSDETNNESAVAAVSVSGTLLMLLIPPDAFPNRANEHIDVSVVSQPIPSDSLGAYLETVAQHGATNLSPVKPFNLDRATGLFITYDLSANGTTNKAQDMVINHNNNTYDIVLNTAAADYAQQLPALQEVLNAWKWSATP
jgi:hypothetical protein